MLQSHVQRIVLTSALMAGFIAAGFAFDQKRESTVDQSGATPAFSQVVHPSAAAAEDDDPSRRSSRAREALSWPFFSFGRNGKRASW